MSEEVVQKDRPFEHLLVEMGLITHEQLSKAMDLAESQNIAVKDAVIALDFTTEEAIIQALMDRFDLKQVDMSLYQEIPPEIISQVSPSVAENYKIIPLGEEDGSLLVAMGDPFNVNALEDL